MGKIDKNMSDTFLSSLIGGVTGSIVTVIGTYFIPVLLDKRKQRKRNKEVIKPRKIRLLKLLKEQKDSNGNFTYPQYEIGVLSAAVGLSEPECKELLVGIGAWGYKTPAHGNRNGDIFYNEYWSLNPKGFYNFEE